RSTVVFPAALSPTRTVTFDCARGCSVAPGTHSSIVASTNTPTPRRRSFSMYIYVSEAQMYIEKLRLRRIHKHADAAKAQLLDVHLRLRDVGGSFGRAHARRAVLQVPHFDGQLRDRGREPIRI